MDEMGGDLVDLVTDGQDVVAYVVDVSGHGFRAGVLMGMIKTAMRYGLLLGQPLAKLFGDLNCVLPAVKEPNMFATLAALRFDGSNEAEYISAGHVPLLQYRQRGREVVRHGMSQFPLGMFARASYVSRRIRYQAEDIFAMVTDGVVEVGADPDAESGLQRLGQILQNVARRPLPAIVDAMQAEARRHGAQQDDQTVLLLKARGVSEIDGAHPSAAPGMMPNHEARWRKLLDELTAELARG
jgi:serine phosphatase RsbU (regulator of sigma subunit)